jgi:hypothetical protein
MDFRPSRFFECSNVGMKIMRLVIKKLRKLGNCLWSFFIKTACVWIKKRRGTVTWKREPAGSLTQNNAHAIACAIIVFCVMLDSAGICFQKRIVNYLRR